MKYTLEEKCLFVKRYHDGESAASLCREKGIPKSTFYSWLVPYSAINVESEELITPKMYKNQKKKIAKLEKIVQILKAANCTVSSPLSIKLEAMETLHGEFSGYLLCEAFEVSRGTFYNHIKRNKRQNTVYAQHRAELKPLILKIFHESNQTFGSLKISVVLHEMGYKTSKAMVSKLMREMGLYSIGTSAKKDYLKWKKGENNNILQQDFCADQPNQKWVSDITIFKVKSIYYYICVIIDLYSRKVISYNISKNNSTQLITNCFRKAYTSRKPESGLIFHSDRGAQYTSYAFRKLLDEHKVKQSLSHPGRPHDNAVSEAFFSILKKEELYRRLYTSEKDFKNSVAKYIANYNQKRPHRALQYKTPDFFENKFFAKRD